MFTVTSLVWISLRTGLRAVTNQPLHFPVSQIIQVRNIFALIFPSFHSFSRKKNHNKMFCMYRQQHLPRKNRRVHFFDYTVGY